MIPSPNTAMRESPPPENRFIIDRKPPAPAAFTALVNLVKSTTGTGTCAPKR